MPENKIIPQMFDVRPVDETGDLDWQKIQSIGISRLARQQEVQERQQPQFEKTVNAYILGVAINSEKAPILHDPNFNVNECYQGKVFRAQDEINQNHWQSLWNEQKRYDQEIIAERKRRDQERMNYLQSEKQHLSRQQQNLSQNIKSLVHQKQLLIAQQLKQEAENQRRIQAEAFKREQLRKNAELIRKQQEAQELAILAEREKQRKDYAKILMHEEIERIKSEKKRRRMEKMSSRNSFFNKQVFARNKRDKFSWHDLIFPQFSFQTNSGSPIFSFVAAALIISLSLGTISYASKGYGLKGKVLGVSQDGYANLNAAIGDLAHQNLEGSSQQFDKAYANFSQASNDLQDMGGILLDATKYFPVISKISSGKNAVEAGKHFSAAGKSLNEIAIIATKIKNPINANEADQPSLLDLLESAEKNTSAAKIELDAAQDNLNQISIDDLPVNVRDKFLLLKQKLPDIRNAMDLFLNNSHILVDLLGGNGPRKYLFLFQNNSEMRATGGFIGTYGLVDISNGKVKKFFIDGIFNPDGQLKDKIVPPVPVQKISAAWSLHDSNWFPDFPLSAKKAINFYEKTGGPTADGVITFTPAVMQKLLQITGPIEMPEYDVTLDADNFIELTQFKVEADYDKEENKPKKILSDLAPLVLDKLLASRDLETMTKAAQAILSGLQEKHILFYSENNELENIIKKQGWSGEILPAAKDYISVINTNINGYKTDAIVDESIDHKAEIQADGSIVDTVTITRKHNGGASQYEWLNKVNADYMRVYVPQGSKLLEVSGQTREQDAPPLDYDALGFKRDSDVQKEEQNITIDSASGTRIYNESGKTVFANWTYVSPQETMTITYKYLLPFSLFQVSVGNSQQLDSYSLVAQKQSGSFGSKFTSHISYPPNFNSIWSMPNDMQATSNELSMQSDLKIDRFEGIVFEKK